MFAQDQVIGLIYIMSMIHTDNKTYYYLNWIYHKSWLSSVNQIRDTDVSADVIDAIYNQIWGHEVGG